MTPQDLSNLLLPKVSTDTETYEKKYPPRDLNPEAIVSRLAPSPTGFTHIGTIYAALVPFKMAQQTKGVFFLRIEDTDQKREIEGAQDLIISSLQQFGINFNEGPTLDKKEIGAYGPYIQSQREAIYQTYAKKMIEDGKAYPCFCTPEELADTHKKQETAKMRTGYYKQWATCRTLSPEDIQKKVSEQKTFAIRFRNTGEIAIKRKIVDLVKGTVTMPETDNDVVILKSDGIPTYHFAHIIDDHLMRTTHVVRGDEWLASVPLHLQLFEAMGWQAPHYAHLAPIQKIDAGNKRKLSKRKDPEAAVSFYFEQGYLVEAVLEYLYNLLDSGFEPWREKNLTAPLTSYELKFENLGTSGALLDFAKLDNVSREYFSKLEPMHVYSYAIEWATIYDPELLTLLNENMDYWLKIFNIEHGQPNRRKDLAKLSELKPNFSFFLDSEFTKLKFKVQDFMPNVAPETVAAVCQQFTEKFNPEDDKMTWLALMKQIGESLGYAPEVKLFKQNPEKYKGHFGEITQILRIVLTGRTQSPDLYEIIQIMGQERVLSRIKSATSN